MFSPRLRVLAERVRQTRIPLNVRASYLGLALGTIALGLAIHWHGGVLGPTARDVLGDALWAAMIYWWIGALAPGATLRVRAVMALMVCFGVEVSQLYHTPALDALRRTTLGQLVLGSGFDPRDLVAYAGGIVAAVGLEHVTMRRRGALSADRSQGSATDGT